MIVSFCFFHTIVHYYYYGRINSIVYKLFRLQKKAIRVIAKQKYNAHTDPLFKEYKLLKIEDIFKTQSLKFLHKQKR